MSKNIEKKSGPLRTRWDSDKEEKQDNAKDLKIYDNLEEDNTVDFEETMKQKRLSLDAPTGKFSIMLSILWSVTHVYVSWLSHTSPDTTSLFKATDCSSHIHQR